MVDITPIVGFVKDKIFNKIENIHSGNLNFSPGPDIIWDIQWRSWYDRETGNWLGSCKTQCQFCENRPKKMPPDTKWAAKERKRFNKDGITFII
jgi:hypothetical protein